VDIAISVQEAIEKPMDEFRLRADELGADDADRPAIAATLIMASAHSNGPGRVCKSN
jgi:hypothetical protein